MYEGAEHASAYVDLRFQNEKQHYTLISLAGIREVRHEDVPLAPLDEVTSGLEREIEAGRIRKVSALRLGYVLYSDPNTTEYAWAIPYWLADCEYYETAETERNEFFHAQDPVFYEEWEFAEIPIHAQTAKPILYDMPSKEVLELPLILTWAEN